MGEGIEQLKNVLRTGGDALWTHCAGRTSHYYSWVERVKELLQRAEYAAFRMVKAFSRIESAGEQSTYRILGKLPKFSSLDEEQKYLIALMTERRQSEDEFSLFFRSAIADLRATQDALVGYISTEVFGWGESPGKNANALEAHHSDQMHKFGYTQLSSVKRDTPSSKLKGHTLDESCKLRDWYDSRVPNYIMLGDKIRKIRNQLKSGVSSHVSSDGKLFFTFRGRYAADVNRLVKEKYPIIAGEDSHPDYPVTDNLNQENCYEVSELAAMFEVTIRIVREAHARHATHGISGFMAKRELYLTETKARQVKRAEYEAKSEVEDSGDE